MAFAGDPVKRLLDLGKVGRRSPQIVPRRASVFERVSRASLSRASANSADNTKVPSATTKYCGLRDAVGEGDRSVARKALQHIDADPLTV
jgi:hypothetical protein